MKFGFTNKQTIYLQQLNTLLYKRVAQWIKIVHRDLPIRLSEIVCHNPDSTEVFVFPTRAMIEEWNGVLNVLVGLENCDEDFYTGHFFNFILSNGQRSE